MATKEITLSLPLFLDFLTHGNEFAYVRNEEGLVDKLKLIDADEEFLHIQGPLTEKNEHGNIQSGLYKVWLQKYWKVEFERLKLVKEQSERHEILYHKMTADIELLTKRIQEKMKGLDVENARNMAKTWYENNQTALIEMFLGEKVEPVKKEEFHWKKI